MDANEVVVEERDADRFLRSMFPCTSSRVSRVLLPEVGRNARRRRAPAQRPVQRGFRFCAKASGPSLESSLAHRRATAS